MSATSSRSAASPIAEAEVVVFGDDVINDRTYFLCRSTAFWASVVLMVSVGIIMGTWQAFFTHQYVAYMLFSAETEGTNLIDATRLRGAIALTLTGAWIIAFLRRMALARYVVYFGTSFVALNYAMDLSQLALADDLIAMLTSSTYLILRPIMLIALLTSAFSFADSARFERRHVRPGQQFLLSEIT